VGLLIVRVFMVMILLSFGVFELGFRLRKIMIDVIIVASRLVIERIIWMK